MNIFTTEQHKTFLQSKNDALFYKHRAENFLNGETIADSEWRGGGLTLDASSNDTTNAEVKISGGTPGSTYRVINKITTSGGQIKEAYIYIAINDIEISSDYQNG